MGKASITLLTHHKCPFDETNSISIADNSPNPDGLFC